MAKRIPEHELRAIVAVVSAHPEGIAIQDIQKNLDVKMARHRLQHRLKRLVADGRLVMEGSKRGTMYRLPAGEAASPVSPVSGVACDLQLSSLAVQIRANVRRPTMARKHVAYRREFLDSYRPNETAYLSEDDRARLREAGTRYSEKVPAGTLARYVLHRFLVDLSWNSSRLEGSDYSPLEAKRLINFDVKAEGKELLYVQMILNHKDAIEFLVDSADWMGFNRQTILNLHALLAFNLLGNESAEGRLRSIAVGIGASVYQPPNIPQLIEECFDRILAVAESIKDPFEQAFFVMVHLPYLQPFEDVNKRVSRLAANIPLIKANLAPLSFTEIPVETYTEAVLAVYELNRIELLKELFIWAYEHSAALYAPAKKTEHVPDTVHLKHYRELDELIKAVVVERLDRKSTFARIAQWAKASIGAGDIEKFREIAESEILALHEYSVATYKISQEQFGAWQEVWNKP